MSELKKQTVSGVKWLVGSSFLQKAIQTGATVVLARILGPADFGLFALAFVAIDALGLFKSMGFDSALVQRKDNIEEAANTAFFIIPVLGTVLYFILALSAPWIGRFLNNQDVVGVIRALGIIFVISCLGKVPAALLEKNMRFRQVSIIEIGAAVLYSLSAITFALFKLGVWSLVYAYILKTLYQNVLTFVYSRWRPRLEFDPKIAKEMFNFGKYIFLGAVVWFLKMNLDNILVGKMLGVVALGFYAVAFNIANFGADYFGSKVFRVTFPAYSKLQSQLLDLKFAVLKVFKKVSLFVLPLGVVTFILSNDIINLIYGEKWLPASLALKSLALAGIFNALNTTIGSIYWVFKKTKLSLFIMIIEVSIFFIFIIPLAKMYGIIGVGLVVSLGSCVTFFINLIYLKKLLSIKISEVFISLKPSLFSSLIMTIGILIFKYMLKQINITKSFQLNFVLLIMVALSFYAITLFKIEKSLFKETKELLFK